ncbi:MAG: nitrate/sulfonate/bicarbonate transporter permease [Acidimicrobiaceae bacterium]|jgi:ABC-type nitrate/sulfonate/bicarbonate transport system permease component|nr:nitrate/sulfonate/bicarbonate transporter permease [Acidimicrobiaceae bacterium]
MAGTAASIATIPSHESADEAEPLARNAPPRVRWKRTLPYVSVLIVVGLWQIIGSHINPILLSTPSATVAAFGHMISNGQLIPAFGTAMEDLWVGFGLAIVVGIATGVLMGRSEVAERVLDPYINFFQATPLIALVPLVVIWFGIGFEARIATTFILAVWSIIINTFVGVRSTPSALIDVASVYKLNRREIISKITLPNAVPYIFAGLRIALGKALIGMLIAEMEVSVTGLGGLVVNYGNSFRTAYLLAGVFTASAVGVIGVILLNLVKRWFFPWVNATTAEGVRY